MTTIACDLEVMASDSLCVTNFVDYPVIKIERIRGALLGGAGDCNSLGAFFEWYRAGKPKKRPVALDELKDIESFEVLELNKRGLFHWFGFYAQPIERERHAIGAGGQAAMAAMLLGKSPAEAVDVSCKVVPSTTMRPVRQYFLDPKRAPTST